jgi:hypothetical protein
MDADFSKFVRALHKQFVALMRMSPLRVGAVPKNTPKGGVYLISKGGRHLYAGRTKRTLAKRLQGHFNTAKDCPFAFRLARERTGRTEATYSVNGSRKALLADPLFIQQYEAAKREIRDMDVRWVHEPHPLKQALLEVYVHVALKTPYNDFGTT